MFQWITSSRNQTNRFGGRQQNKHKQTLDTETVFIVNERYVGEISGGREREGGKKEGRKKGRKREEGGKKCYPKLHKIKH